MRPMMAGSPGLPRRCLESSGATAGGSEQVTFVDATHGWALGAVGLYRTTNGLQWTQITVLGPVPGGAPSPST